MNKAIKLANPEISTQAILGSGIVDAVMSIPVANFGEAEKHLDELIRESPDYSAAEWDQEQLRLLCAAFWTAFKRLPIGPYEYLRLLDRYDEDLSGGQYVRGFVAEYMTKDADPALCEMSGGALDELDRRITRVKQERGAGGRRRNALTRAA